MKAYKYLFLLFLVFCLLLQPALGLAPTRAEDQTYPNPTAEPTPATPGLANNPRFLPLLSYFPANSAKNIFGVENFDLNPGPLMDLVRQSGAAWLRRNSLEWRDVEPAPGVRDWTNSNVVKLESELTYAATQKAQVILIIHKTPVFARQVTASACGPIKDASLADFASFMFDVVQRYSAPPFNVKYFEIWNEPDVPVMTLDEVYGCWGDANQPYFGGLEYGQMLKQVTPQMKAANPAIQVLMGGVVLDCNPVNPPLGKNCQPATYFEGILAAGAGDFFDGVNFHSYDYYYQGLGKFGNTNWNSTWNTSGPALIAKTHYLKSILAKYGLAKPIYLTETSLLCDKNCDANFQTTKAYYLVQTYVASLAERLEATVWYSLIDTWRENGLVARNGVPYPAFYAFTFAQSKLGTAQKTTDRSAGNIRAYEIVTTKGTFWVAWSRDGSAQTLHLTATPLAGWDLFGTPVTVAKAMPVALAPVYIEMP